MESIVNKSRVSIVTKSEIRYEGILYKINPEEKNITLQNVQSFGTEGRRSGNEIQPSIQIYEMIVFKGSDIKDLMILGQKQDQQQEEKPKQIKDIKDDEFDFENLNKKFIKMQINQNFQKYEQKNFFDNISCSTTEKTRETREDRQKQLVTDGQTFGEEMIKNAQINMRKYQKNNNRNNYKNKYQNQRSYNNDRNYQKYVKQPYYKQSEGEKFQKEPYQKVQ